MHFLSRAVSGSFVFLPHSSDFYRAHHLFPLRPESQLFLYQVASDLTWGSWYFRLCHVIDWHVTLPECCMLLRLGFELSVLSQI